MGRARSWCSWGVAVAGLGPAIIVLALRRYLQMHRALVEGTPAPTDTGTAIALAVGAGGVSMLVIGGMIVSALR